MSYTMNYATSKGKFDEEVVAPAPSPAGAGAGSAAAGSATGGAGGAAPAVVRVFIEPNALMKVAGTTMDWREDDVAAEFVFNNPNAKAVCGCGESFSV